MCDPLNKKPADLSFNWSAVGFPSALSRKDLVRYFPVTKNPKHSCNANQTHTPNPTYNELREILQYPIYFQPVTQDDTFFTDFEQYKKQD